MAADAKIRLSAEDNTRAAFASVTRNFDRLRTSGAAVVGGLAAIGGAVAAAGVALQGFKAVTTVLDRLDDLQEKTGISVEKLSELRYAGEVTGTPFEALASGIGRLGKAMAETAGGNKDTAATFKALGVEVVDSNGKLRSTEDVLGDLATRFAGYEDGPAKAALAQRLFGKSGADLIPILNQGRAGLARLGDEAKKLGAVYDKDTARAAAELNDNLAKLKLASEGAAVSIAGPLVKALADLSGQFVDAKKNGDAWQGTLAFLKAASWANPVAHGINLAKTFAAPGAAAAKSTKQIQEYVNAIGGLSAGPGRGFVNPQVAAPVIADDDSAAKGAKADPLAEAKRYLESLQKQQERLQELSVEQQTLRDLELKRLGQVTPELEKQILATARLVDLQKAQADGLEASERAARAAAAAADSVFQEAEKLRESVATPFEKLQETLAEIERIAEKNPLVSVETVARLNTKAWNEYLATLDVAIEKTSELDAFNKRAAENIQDYLGDGLFNILEGNFSDIGKSFSQMVNRMIAEAAAAKISRHLFGDLVSGGTGKGVAGGLLDQVGSMLLGGGGSSGTKFGNNPSAYTAPSSGGGFLSFLSSLIGGSFASGTDYVPKDMLAVIHKGEAVVPAAENARGGRGDINYSPTFVLSGPVDRRTQDQIAVSAMSGAQRAWRRNG